MANKYNSPTSVGYRKPIMLYSEDPRAKSQKEYEKYAASIGAEIIVKTKPVKTIVLDEYIP